MKITEEAFRAFYRWCDEHDPDGETDLIELALAYGQWLNTHSIERYLDPNGGGTL